MHSTTPSVHGRNQPTLSSRASAAGQSWDLGTAGSREQQRWRCRDREDTGLWRAEARSRAEPTCIRSQRAAPNPSSLGGDAWEDADRRLNQPGGGGRKPPLPAPGGARATPTAAQPRGPAKSSALGWRKCTKPRSSPRWDVSLPSLPWHGGAEASCHQPRAGGR